MSLNPAGSPFILEMGIRERVAFLDSILQAPSEYSITAHDLNGRLLAWNEGARREFGAELPHGNAFDSRVYHPEDVESGHVRQILDTVLESGSWSGELRRPRHDKAAVPAFVTIMLRRGKDGQPVGFVHFSRDLTEQHRVLRELRESQDYNRGLTESNMDALITTDTLGVIVDVNAQMCEMTGALRETLIGSLFKDYFTDPKLAVDGIYKVLEEGRVRDYELVMRSAAGKMTTVSYNAASFRAADGQLKGVLAAARDITAQKRLEVELQQAQNYTRGLIEASFDALLTVNTQLHIIDINEQTATLTGYTREELLGSLFSRYFTDPQRAGAVVAKTLTESRVNNYILGLRTKAGQEALVSFNASVFKDTQGTVRGIFMAGRDITEQKRLEEQLQRKNEELEEQNRRVQEATRLKSEFLANMSHELRTPLNGIIGFAQLMHDGKVGPVSADHEEYLGDILTSSRHLQQLINDVLDLAKVESGKMEFRPEPVDLTRVVKEVCDILRTLTAEKRLRLETFVDPALRSIVADPAKLKQVLYNYLSNAIKFTPDEGRVSIRASLEGADSFRLEVEDTGIGIREEDFSRLFVEFQQLDSSSAKKFQGTGLGLALTRRIVEAQRGEVGVTSTPGLGSTFYAVLPRRAETPFLPQEDRLPQLRQPGQLAVLVVEDDRKERAWVLETLVHAGYCVETAATGQEALKAVQARPFDAITLDLLLPDMSGWEVLNAIRSSQLNHDVPAIVLTVAAEKGHGLGFVIQDFLTKPVHAAELLRALGRVRLGDGQHTLLIIDDDPNMSKLIELGLDKQRYAITTARDGAAGLVAALEQQPSAVVLDLLMPCMDGFEFLYQFRLTEVGRRTPVIVWTDKDLTGAERIRLQAAAQAIVTKGAGSAEALVAELEIHVARAQRSPYAK